MNCVEVAKSASASLENWENGGVNRVEFDGGGDIETRLFEAEPQAAGTRE